MKSGTFVLYTSSFIRVEAVSVVTCFIKVLTRHGSCFVQLLLVSPVVGKTFHKSVYSREICQSHLASNTLAGMLGMTEGETG